MNSAVALALGSVLIGALVSVGGIILLLTSAEHVDAMHYAGDQDTFTEKYE
jgi:hypothetical protein